MEQVMKDEVDVVLKSVTKKFDDFVAVQDFDLEVKRGEYVCLLGPSGCGKTTTLRMIAGHEEPTTGDVFIRGRRVNDLSPVERGTTMMFQNFALFPHMNVFENVEFGLKMQKVEERKRQTQVDDMLKRIGLYEFRHRRPHEISGGQQQRVALGRSLVTEPSVLLLDEPIGSLDELLRVQMRGELKLLQRRLGLTFIHVTHNQDECLCMGDRLVVMSDGIIEQAGTPYEIYCQPETLFVAEFVGDNNIFRGRIADVDGKKATVDTDRGKFVVETEREIPEKGATAALSIRADLVSARKQEGTGDNRLAAKVRFVEYLGFYVKLRLELEDGTEFHMKQHQDVFFTMPRKEGDSLIIEWSAKDAVLLPGEEKRKKLYT